MTIACIGDTHGKHDLLEIPDTDVIIHTGDISSFGNKQEIAVFLEWFAGLPQKHKIFIAGNHDFYLEKIASNDLENFIPQEIIFLQNTGIEIGNKLFWGSAYTPGLPNFAFYKQRGKEIFQEWKKIPQQTDVLITHTPPYGILDEVARKQSVGCEELQKVVAQLQPSFHIFGHVHESYGLAKIKATSYINASSFLAPNVPNQPIIIDL